jgi:hypothetical protein
MPKPKVNNNVVRIYCNLILQVLIFKTDFDLAEHDSFRVRVLVLVFI